SPAQDEPQGPEGQRVLDPMTRPLHLAFVAIAVSGCDASKSPVTEPDTGIGSGPQDAAVGDSASDGIADGPVEIPPTPVGDRLRWLIDLLNGDGSAITETRVRPAFSTGFLAQVPASTVVALLREKVRTGSPFVLVGFEGVSAAEHLVAILRDIHGRFERVVI